MSWRIASDEDKGLPTQIVRSPRHKNEQTAPPGAIHIGILKAIETELCRRNLLGVAAAYATPLWFLAETERNIFLWRSGRSIGDLEDFSFWVDTKALILKRRGQLARSKGFNPFVAFSPSSGSPESESLYLDTLEALSERISSYAEALSEISDEILTSESSLENVRHIVLLPCCTPLSPLSS